MVRGSFATEQGVVRRVPLDSNKDTARLMLVDRLKRAAAERNGLIDRFADHRKRPLTLHLDDWRTALLAKGGTAKYADLITGRARRVLTGCRFNYWTDLSASRVQAYIAELRDGGTDRPALSIQSRNFYLQACKQFCRWMILEAAPRRTRSPTCKAGTSAPMAARSAGAERR